MANPPSNDGDMSEFEKLTNSLEFENKQYVKMIEKENQLIASLQTKIQEGNEVIHRTESDISRLDEETMRLHKQFLHAKETFKNLKDTYNVMMDHEMALTKQLETLKIKSDGEKQFYQEQIANYSKIRDEYIKKYKSFPLAQELDEKKEILSEMQKESVEREATIAELQQKIVEKEAILDSKVMSRMIINIAKLKLSTTQIEKEVHECLVEKTSLLEQLKEIQRIQEPQQFSDRKEPIKFDDDNSMDCDDNIQENSEDLDGNQTSYNIIKENLDGVTNVTNNNDDVDLIKNIAPVQEDTVEECSSDIHPGIKSEAENQQQEKYDSNIATKSHIGRSSRISDIRPQSSNASRFGQVPQTMKAASSTMSVKGHSNITSQNSAPSLTASKKRISSVPQFKPIQRPLPKTPTIKPFELSKPSREISKENQNVTPPVSRAESPRPSVPAFTHKISLPSLRFPRSSFQSNRSTDSSVGNKGASSLRKPIPTTDLQQPSSTASVITESSTFSVPKIPGLSTPTSSYSMTSSHPLVQQNKPRAPIIPGNLQDLRNLPFEKHCQNQTDKNESPVTPAKEPEPFKQNIKNAAPEYSLGTEVTKQSDRRPEKHIEEDQSHVELHENGFSVSDELGQPLFKPTSFSDTLLRDRENFSTPKSSCAFVNTNLPKQTAPTTTPAAFALVNPRKEPERKKFNIGSVFNHSEESSRSPTAFGLINLGGGENEPDHDTPFLSFGNASVSDTDGEEQRPNSLINLFNTPGKSTNSNPGSQLNFDSHNNENEKGGTSFFSFGKSSKDDDEDDRPGGGFFNFGKGFGKDDDDDESDGKEPFFKLF